jgi:hypothetical protein
MSKPYVAQGGNVVLIGKAAAINSGSIAGLQGVAVLTARRKVVLRAASGPAGVFVVGGPGRGRERRQQRAGEAINRQH